MKIVTVPHPALRAISQPIDRLDTDIHRYLTDMADLLRHKSNPQGVGLSAPQVNHNLRAFCTFLDHGSDSPEIRFFINPKITKTSDTKTLGSDPDKPIMEGCLSIPGIWGPVWRFKWIKLTYFEFDPKTLELIPKKKRFDSFPARVIQHELDHLDGILFTDHSLTDNQPVYQDQKGTLIPIRLSTKL